MGTAAQNNANAPIAFVLVICAGMSTCIGAAIVFNTRLVKMASKRFLAGSLGAAAGVMLYVSLIEIFVKSQESFSAHGCSDADAYMYASLSLFGGIALYMAIDFTVHLLEGDVGSHNTDIYLYDLDDSSSGGIIERQSSTPTCKISAAINNGQQQQLHQTSEPCRTRASPELHEHDIVVELGSRSIIRPSADLHTLNLRMAGKVQRQRSRQHDSPPSLSPGNKAATGEGRGVPVIGEDIGVHHVRAENGETTETASGAVTGNGPGGDDTDKRLVRMGLMAAVAIGLHNFPEGLATFVGALSDPSVGIALAVAIAIHNIPEGVCVAIPVYYGTGNRWKAFGWAFLSGVSEPIGAALGWIILKDIMSELVYGILFGIVSGMMVTISLHQLIPTAVRYDPTDNVTTHSIVAGMAIMALSLALFLY